MQHSPFDQSRPGPVLGEGRARSRTPIVVPGPDEAIEFPWNASIGRSRGVHGFNSMDARSRSFNLVRAKLLTTRRERSWRMIGIVSATPSVGKSFISANLAASISRDPRFRTYLIDLDLRRGAMKDMFGIDTDGGVATFLSQGHDGDMVPAFRPEGQNLIIVPNVPGHIRSAELLAGERASALMLAMRNSDQKNFFIFDLPPVFADDDAATTMDLLDCYVLIAEEGRTTQREVEAAVEMLGPQRLAGVILNKYRGGLISEGRGIEARYASGYYASDSDEDGEA